MVHKPFNIKRKWRFFMLHYAIPAISSNNKGLSDNISEFLFRIIVISFFTFIILTGGYLYYDYEREVELLSNSPAYFVVPQIRLNK